MKIAMYSLLTLILSALVFIPTPPKEYPTKDILEEKSIILHKEQRLKYMIEKVEYGMKLDSIEIESLKRNIN